MKATIVGLALGAFGAGLSAALAGNGIDSHWTHFLIGQLTSLAAVVAGYLLGR
ncbi:MAG: hypothetical protein ACOCYE_10390 [Pseudomonadota bacterium]